MAAATMCVTPDGAGDKSGSSWANAMDTAAFFGDLVNSSEAGDLYYVYTGTYTFTQTWNSTRSGSGTAPIRLIGVQDQNATPTPAEGTNRPLFSLGSYYFGFGGYGRIENVRISGTGQYGLYLRNENCAVINVSVLVTGSTGRAIETGYYYIYLEDCDVSATGSNGIGANLNTQNTIIRCWIHDCPDTGLVGGTNTSVFNSIFSGCGKGVGVSGYFSQVNGSTFYSCTSGIYNAGERTHQVVNSDFDTCTTGINHSADRKCDSRYCNFYNCGTDVTNNTKGVGAAAVSSGFVSTANKDFRTASTSTMRNIGIGIRVGTNGNTTDVDIGADQHADPAAADGGGPLVGPSALISA